MSGKGESYRRQQ